MGFTFEYSVNDERSTEVDFWLTVPSCGHKLCKHVCRCITFSCALCSVLGCLTCFLSVDVTTNQSHRFYSINEIWCGIYVVRSPTFRQIKVSLVWPFSLRKQPKHFCFHIIVLHTLRFFHPPPRRARSFSASALQHFPVSVSLYFPVSTSWSFPVPTFCSFPVPTFWSFSVPTFRRIPAPTSWSFHVPTL